MVGILALTLFFSPIIDWILEFAHQARHTPWFNSASGVIRLGRLLAAVGTTIGILLVFASTGSRDALIDAVGSALDALIP
jgi:hypothetical protein